jgi:magnesium transporter
MKGKTAKVGLPPGTIDYVGEERTNAINITVVCFNEADYYEQTYSDYSECVKSIRPSHITWINFDGVHNVKLIEAVGKTFNIHPLTLLRMNKFFMNN